MTHQQIEVTAKGKYNNIAPKRDLDQDKFCIVRKKFDKGFEKTGVGKTDGVPYKYFAHNVVLVQPDGTEQEVSFLLYEAENTAFEAAGGIDEQVRIWCRKNKALRNPLFITFERVTP